MTKHVIMFQGRNKQRNFMRVNTTHSRIKNLKMNDQVYALRRKVIDIIYTLKKDLDLPRIEVRIMENHETILASGTMDNTSVIWITESSANLPYENLLHLVAHEVGHAVFKLKHSNKCQLMKQGNTLNNPCTLEQIIKILKK